MARIRMLNIEDLPEDDRDVLDRPINLYRVFAHTPELARRYATLGRWFRFDGALDNRIREMAILQVGLVAASPYEWSHHIEIGRQAGVSDDDIRAIVAETEGDASGLDPMVRSVLRFARGLTCDGTIPAAVWAEVASRLDEAQLVELSALVAFYAMTVRFLNVLQIDVEDHYAPYLDRFPIGGEAGS